MILQTPSRFTFDTHGVFSKAVADVFSSGRTPTVLDFSNTVYIDSAALGLLLIVRDKLSTRGVQTPLRIINAKDETLQVLRIANFDKIFIIE